MTRQKTRILFIHHGVGLGGALVSLGNLVKNLDSDKYDCSVALVKSSAAAEELLAEHGIAFEVIGSSNCWFAHHESGKVRWVFFYQYFKVFAHWIYTAFWVAPRYLQSREFDIVHLNSHVLTSWAFAAKRLGKKVVLHNREAIARGYFGLRYNVLKKLIQFSADAIINISGDNAARLGIDEKASVIYNSVEVPKTYRLPMQASQTTRRVLYLGGMANIKGYPDVVECLLHLNDDIVVQFAGNLGKLEPAESAKRRLKNWIKLNVLGAKYKLFKRLLASENSEVLGLLKDPTRAIDGCDILITPFRTEHFSRPAIEAFAYGKPVIGSNVRGMDEIVDDGVDGLLVERSNPIALAKAINFLCSNPEVAREMGRRGREKAIKLFSTDSNIRKVEALYCNLLE